MTFILIQFNQIHRPLGDVHIGLQLRPFDMITFDWEKRRWKWCSARRSVLLTVLKDFHWIASPWPTLELPRWALSKNSNDPFIPREKQCGAFRCSSRDSRTSLVALIEVDHQWFDRALWSNCLSCVEWESLHHASFHSPFPLPWRCI